MKRMASPVDFISGPSSLLTPGNLLKENTGSLMAKPFDQTASQPRPSFLPLLAWREQICTLGLELGEP